MTSATRKLHDSEPWALKQLALTIREACGEDDQAFLDTLDGETDAIDAARAVVRHLAELEVNEAAMKDLGDQYRQRARIMSDRQVAARAALLRFLENIEERSLSLPEATLTVKAGTVSLLGEADPTTLPANLVRTKLEPNKAAIKAALEAGETVPGFALSNGAPSLQVRRA